MYLYRANVSADRTVMTIVATHFLCGLSISEGEEGCGVLCNGGTRYAGSFSSCACCHVGRESMYIGSGAGTNVPVLVCCCVSDVGALRLWHGSASRSTLPGEHGPRDHLICAMKTCRESCGLCKSLKAGGPVCVWCFFAGIR